MLFLIMQERELLERCSKVDFIDEYAIKKGRRYTVLCRGYNFTLKISCNSVINKYVSKFTICTRHDKRNPVGECESKL
jgi:hypothetical protein